MPDSNKKTAATKPAKPVASKKVAKTSSNQAVAANASKPKAKKATTASTASPSKAQAKKTANTEVTVHKTTEPSKTKKRFGRGVKSVVAAVRSRHFWAWVGGFIIITFVILVGWWQWQRSYVAIVGNQFLPVSMMDEQLRANYGTSGVDSIIQQQLILQEAKRKNIAISDDKVQEQLDKIKQSSGGEESYYEQLKQLGISEDLLRTQVQVQLLREELLADKIAVTDQEINDYYEQNKASIDPDGSQGVEGLHDTIESNLRQTKLESETPNLVDSLEQNTRVETHLDHLSLTFPQFLQDTIVPIPGDIWNFVTGQE